MASGDTVKVIGGAVEDSFEQFEYDESIAAGDLLKLINDTGATKVRKIRSSDSFHSASIFSSSDVKYIASAYDSKENKIIIAYRDITNANAGTAIVGTVFKDSISFGAPTVFNAAITNHIDLIVDPDSGSILVAYSDGSNNNRGNTSVGEYLGDSINFAPSSLWNNTPAVGIILLHDNIRHRIIIIYGNTSNYTGYVVVGAISGTNFTVEGTGIFGAGENVTDVSAVYDTYSKKIVIVYRDYVNSIASVIVANVLSNSSVVFGSMVVFNSNSLHLCIGHDPLARKNTIAFTDSINGGKATVMMCEIIGTDIILSKKIVFSEQLLSNFTILYDPKNEKMVISFRSINENIAAYISGKFMKDTIVFDNPVTFNTAASIYISTSYATASNQIIFSYTDSNSQVGPGASVFFNDIRDSAFGIAQESGSAGEIKDVATISEYSEVHSGWEAGDLAYIQEDCTLSKDKTDYLMGIFTDPTKLKIMLDKAKSKS